MSDATPSIFVHPNGLCESAEIGEGTRIWAFAHILPGARIGDDCNICDHVFIENDVRLGSRVTVKSGVQLWDGVELGDDVFVGPNASFTNDPFPRSRAWPDSFPRIRVANGASIGANATILPGIHIGERAMVGAGAVVTKDLPPYAIAVGNPARVIGFASDKERTDTPAERSAAALAEDDPRLLSFHEVAEKRGSLAVIDFAADLPFVPKRSFLVYGVPGGETRGNHAHRRCEQVLVVVAGRVSVFVDDGRQRFSVTLDGPTHGLHLPVLHWGTQWGHSDDAILQVFASEPYDRSDYITSYAEFRALATPPR
ncbi:MAG: WxcM-like domain-containing protein [Fulvimarina manganoxydans]|uniref:WxcM-like domain-containing protein n=1 Tax=Fulvimarina manganoxydans TaxID=937218 RepID=UPI002354BB91|nr:WxcM-like domain-containing protein [Fulvimarina manganoxydans]MCK5933087.1 WxcM-like domain-containing protein [Fulvimarina manganoxydans]